MFVDVMCLQARVTCGLGMQGWMYRWSQSTRSPGGPWSRRPPLRFPRRMCHLSQGHPCLGDLCPWDLCLQKPSSHSHLLHPSMQALLAPLN